MSATSVEPHGRHAVALELAAVEDGMTLVDWGSARGEFAVMLAHRHPTARVVACDIPYPHGAPALDVPNAEYHVLEERRPRLPLVDASVDRVFLLDVLEHMGPESRRASLAEIRRLLDPAGSLVVTVPHRGRLSRTDVENVRFRWPRTHRLVFSLVRGRSSYRERYESFAHPNYSSDAKEHHHFTLRELVAVLRAEGFEVHQHAPFGLLYPLYWTLALAVEFLRRLTRGELSGLERVAWSLGRRSLDARPPLAWADSLGVRASPAPLRPSPARDDAEERVEPQLVLSADSVDAEAQLRL
jgi:SAM-dependent methyltransferase